MAAMGFRCVLDGGYSHEDTLLSTFNANGFFTDAASIGEETMIFTGE
jgi:hypothetical protein